VRSPLAFLLVLLCALAAAPTASAASNDPLRSHQWGLDMIEADAAHATSTGSGAVVAVIDTGVLATHEDLAGRLVPGFDFIDTPNDPTPQDENGHGTHVTGIIAANSGNGKGIEGVAPGAKVMPIRVLGADGSGTGEGVAKGVDFAVAHHADVINLSLGGDAVSTIVGGDDAFTAAVNRAIAAGVVVVAAAGNDSLPICEQPATQGKLLCVGAEDSRGMRSFFSSSGDIVAPGGSGLGGDEDILSTYNDGKYTEIAGTSQATPHVAGVAALLVSLGLHGQKVIERLLATATPGGTDGTPRLNARTAVAGLGSAGGGGGSNNGGGGQGGGTSGGASISYALTQKIGTVRKRGVRVRCKATASGRCQVTVTARGRTIASGSRKVAAGHHVTVAARLTRAGKQLLRGKTRLRARISVAVPGANARIKGPLTLVR
jgi:subtilisin family serine protease